jgi:hypothetical protein
MSVGRTLRALVEKLNAYFVPAPGRKYGAPLAP